MMPKDIDEVAEALKQLIGQSTTVDGILRLVGASNRSHVVREQVATALAEAGLVLEPDWELADRDEPILVRPVESPVDDGGDSGADADPGDPSLEEEPSVVPEITPTIRLLLEGRQAPTTVKPSEQLEKAIHLMLTSHLDYLPVVDEQGGLMGAVTWKTYSAMRVADHPAVLTNAIEVNPPTVQDRTDLMEAVSVIAARGYVLVRDEYGKMCGLVTMADLAMRYRDLLAPFQKIGEIERMLRRRTNARLAATDFDAAWRGKTSAEQLTFGQYRKLLEDPVRWAKFGLAIDCGGFCQLLGNVKTVRNMLAHFDTDNITESQLQDVDQLRSLLRSLDPR